MSRIEDAAQLPKAGSLRAAEAWFEDAAYEEWESAWRRVEPAYRRVLAERVAVEEGLDFDDPETSALIEDAAEEGHDQELWSQFGEDQCLLFLKEAMTLDSRGWIIYPQPVALDCELVLLVDVDNMVEPSEIPEAFPARPVIEVMSPVATESPPQRVVTSGLRFYMRRDDYGDWLIAGFNEEPPDWPTPAKAGRRPLE